MPGRMHLTWQGRSLLPALAACLALLLSGLLGLLAPKYGVLTLAPVVAVAGLGLVTWRPILGVFLAALFAAAPWTLSTGLSSSSVLSAQYCLVILLFAGYLLNTLIERKTFRISTLGKIITLYTAWSFSTYFFSQYSTQYTGTLPLLRRANWSALQSVYPIVAILVANAVSNGLQRRKVLLALTAGAVVSGVFGPIEYIRQTLIFSTQPAQFSGDSMRIDSFFTGPTAYGLYLSMTITVLVSLTLWRKQRPAWWSNISLVCLGLLAVNLLLTFTRSAWIIAAAWVLAVVLWRAFRSSNRTGRLRILLTLMVLISAFAIGSTLLPQDLRERISTIGTITQDDSALTREERWAQIGPAVLDAPILGHGDATVSDDLAPDSSFGEGATPHNNYIYVGLVSGVPALLLLICILLGSARVLLRLRRVAASVSDNCVLLATFGVLSVVVIGGMFESVFGELKLQMVLWLVIGLLLSLEREFKERSVAHAASAKSSVELGIAAPLKAIGGFSAVGGGR